jgi:hypothetical protein
VTVADDSSSDEDELPPKPTVQPKVTSGPAAKSTSPTMNSRPRDSTMNVLRLDPNSYSELMNNLRRFSVGNGGDNGNEMPAPPSEDDFPKVPGHIPSAPDFAEENNVEVPRPSFH